MFHCETINANTSAKLLTGKEAFSLFFYLNYDMIVLMCSLNSLFNQSEPNHWKPHKGDPVLQMTEHWFLLPPFFLLPVLPGAKRTIRHLENCKLRNRGLLRNTEVFNVDIWD